MMVRCRRGVCTYVCTYVLICDVAKRSHVHRCLSLALVHHEVSEEIFSLYACIFWAIEFDPLKLFGSILISRICTKTTTKALSTSHSFQSRTQTMILQPFRSIERICCPILCKFRLIFFHFRWAKLTFSTNCLLNGKENLSGYTHNVCILWVYWWMKRFHHNFVPLNHLINSVPLFGHYTIFMSVPVWSKSFLFSICVHDDWMIHYLININMRATNLSYKIKHSCFINWMNSIWKQISPI